MGMELHDRTPADLSGSSRTISDKTVLNGIDLALLKCDVSHCLVELRSLVDEARSAVLEVFGLSEAIRHRIGMECALRPRTAVSFVDDLTTDPCNLFDDIAFCFFRIAQEVFHNAFKHAAVPAIDVTLAERKGALTLCVRENGCGLEAHRKRNRGGLYNMQTRASLFGAMRAIEPIKPRGAKAFLSAPVASGKPAVARP